MAMYLNSAMTHDPIGACATGLGAGLALTWASAEELIKILRMQPKLKESEWRFK
jgi:hypothetical protein